MTELIARSPFARHFSVELPSFRQDGHVALHTAHSHSTESGPGVLLQLSSIRQSHHSSSPQGQSLSSEQPLFAEPPKPTLSERLARLRPHGCIGIGFFTTIDVVHLRDD